MYQCDHTSVGAIVLNSRRELLMFKRNTPPFGVAGPAGHCDGDTWDDALKKEVWEEVGLEVVASKLFASFNIGRACRRPYSGEPGHAWHFFLTQTSHLKITPSQRETKEVRWYAPEEISSLMQRTEFYHLYNILSEEEWNDNPGLDISWYRLFKLKPALLEAWG